MTEISPATNDLVSNIALFPEENPFPVLRVDAAGVLLYANRAAGELLQEWRCVVGGPVPELLVKELKTVLQSGRTRELEIVCGVKDIFFAMVPIVPRGYVNFYGRDITRRKRMQVALEKSEERLKRAQEIAHLGSWELDLATHHLSWSDEVFRIFGFRPQQFQPSYEAFLAAVHPDDRAAVNAAYTSSVAEGRDVYEIEHRIVRPASGEVRFVHEKCEHSRDAEGRVLRSVGMVHDITERREKELEIQRLNAELAGRARELEGVNRELEAFNYTVAHDLRKPLTAIYGYSQVLREQAGDQIDSTGLGYLDKIGATILQMSQFIDALLEFSHLTQGPLRQERVNLSVLAEELAADLKLADPERRAQFIIPGHLCAEGDAALLRVVLDNLFSNAWKYTAGQEATCIEFGRTERQEVAIFFVRDNGCGFDPALAGQLFLPFHRLPAKEQVSGFGIGLATVERIIRRHGGSIWAVSGAGEGATFLFTLEFTPPEMIGAGV